MVRWRRPDSDPEGDDDLSAERAVWLRAPRETVGEPSTGAWDAVGDDPYAEPAPGPASSDYPPGPASSDYPPGPASSDYPPRHEQPSPDALGDSGRTVYSGEGFGYVHDETYPPEPEPDVDRPPRRRRLVPLLVIAAVLAVLGAAGYGVLAGPPAKPNAAGPEGPGAATPTTRISFQPLVPTLTATATPTPSASASATTSPTASRSATPSPTASTQPGGAVAGTTAPAAVTFAAVAGEGCDNTDPVYNWYTNGEDSSWWTGPGGAAGCGGQALAMPSSGDPYTDTDDYIVWWFETAPVVSGACSADVYIPYLPDNMPTASAARYKILRGRLSSTVIGSYTIDQTANRGRWVRLGTVAISDGKISVHLANRGAYGVFLGAAQARVSCVAS